MLVDSLHFNYIPFKHSSFNFSNSTGVKPISSIFMVRNQNRESHSAQIVQCQCPDSAQIVQSQFAVLSTSQYHRHSHPTSTRAVLLPFSPSHSLTLSHSLSLSHQWQHEYFRRITKRRD